MCEILSVETRIVIHIIMIYDTCPHTYIYTCEHTHTHTHTKHSESDYIKLNLHSLKWAANRGFRWLKTAAWNRKHGRSTVLGK